MNWYYQLPIRRKLTIIILLISTAVLVLSTGVVGLYEWFDYRAALARDTSVLADIVANNVSAALAFQDEKAAGDVLRALRSEPHIVAAGVYTGKGAPFANYIREKGQPTFLKLPRQDQADFEDGILHVFRPVLMNEKRIGTIYLEADLGAIYDRLRLAAITAALVLLGSVFLVLVLASWLQRPISEPILALARTARLIAERRDYSVRAAVVAGGEVGLLTTAFNTMLSVIAETEEALRGTNSALRSEVAERRAAEEKVSAQLSRLAQLNQITRAISERQDVESIFQAVVRSLEEQMPVDFSCVGRYDAKDATLTVTNVGTRSSSLADQLAMSERTSIPIDQNGLSRCVRGELVYEADIREVSMPFPQRLAGGGLRALVVAPLAFESQVFGILVAARREPDSFGSGDCEFIRQLSEHVALAAHQAELYTALQRAYDDLRQTQQAAMQQERLRALGQMASGIAHDINNAIAPVSLYVGSLLEKEPNLSLQAREWLQTIERAIDDVAQTVARMREFYRRREPELALTSINLNQVAEQVINLTRARWWDIPQQRGVVIDVRREFAAEPPPVMGIESEVREALTNLVFNAVDAMPTGGILTLRTTAVRAATEGTVSPTVGRVDLEVVDTGVGMDEETRRRCLEPFFTTKGERGTGLGLAMVYGIARRLGVGLEIDSSPGQGTTVRLSFPVAEGVEPSWLKPSPTRRPVNRLRVLVIDDDPVLLKSLGEILEADGHEVVSAGGGEAGINQFNAALNSSQPFSVVITDLGMPRVDGRKVIRAIHEVAPTTPIVLLTGWGQRMKAEGDVPAGVSGVLSKPPKLAELRDVLASVASPPESDTFG